MKLIIVHYHLRPGGVRRIIELATPFVVAGAREPFTGVTLATGEAASEAWHRAFARSLHPVPVEVFLEPGFQDLVRAARSSLRGGGSNPSRVAGDSLR